MRISRNDLILLFDNLRRHMVDNMPRINDFIGHIYIDSNTMTDGQIAIAIHKLLDIIQQSFP